MAAQSEGTCRAPSTGAHSRDTSLLQAEDTFIYSSGLFNVWHLSWVIRILIIWTRSTRWRNVAIGSADLWTDVSLPMHPKLFSLIEARSGNRPLDVDVPIGDDCDERSLDERIGEPLRKVANRISNLSIFWSGERSRLQSVDDFLRSHVSGCEFTMLETFDLSECSYQEQGKTCLLVMPALKKLVLEGDPETKPRIQASALTDLHFSWTTMTSRDLLPLLAEFPHLEHCHIVNETSGYETMVKPTPWSPSLNNLRSLSVCALCITEMIHFFAHITIPFSACVMAEVEREREVDDDVSFADFLGPRIATFDEMRIKEERRGTTTYAFTSRSGTILRAIDRTSDPTDLISFSSIVSYNNSLSLIELNAKALPSLSHLTNALRSCPLVTHIGVHTQKADFARLLDALQSEEPEKSIPCPRLDSLDCSETEFNRSRLQSFLEFRNSNGLALRKLKTTRGFSDSSVDALTPLIDEHQQVDAQPRRISLAEVLARHSARTQAADI
ncbi:hypothetical protein SISSUDRAFT_1067451 [Sistotremastrum suecicum HHB10207 ss-3]|uniref:F-box domain-containing protein n=1 Tax=Sistotremastrum suecicum HHB10207 ss-3 TaxID=1314776 RepID=A0A165X3W1_9AGAM|nr:hypothetical protein SISSUDRAFT_1067451 [Sistotremastrum suecicum HHB10207 ss-3]